MGLSHLPITFHLPREGSVTASTATRLPLYDPYAVFSTDTDTVFHVRDVTAEGAKNSTDVVPLISPVCTRRASAN